MGAILIVDDERNIRETLAMYIRILGHTVETAADGETAMEAIDRREFDLVVSDIRMEGLGGLGLLRQIREQQGDTAVVLMTAYATVSQAVEAIRLGAYGFLMKPFSPDDVRSADQSGARCPDIAAGGYARSARKRRSRWAVQW